MFPSVFLSRVAKMSYAMFTDMQPLPVNKLNFSTSQQLTDIIHRAIPAKYWPNKKYTNTKKISQQIIIHFYADLNSVKSEQLFLIATKSVIYRLLNKREIWQSVL